MADTKRQVSGISSCVALFHLKQSHTLFFKSSEHSTVFTLDSEDVCDQTDPS